MLPEYADVRAVWVEITSSEDDHGGTGWEFGSCLWSPSTDVNGSKRYQLMWEPQPEDLVLHLYKHKWNGETAHTRLCGFSRIQSPCQRISTPPPNPGRWVASEYYRIDLKEYQSLDNQLVPAELNSKPALLARILEELVPNRPNRYPLSTYGPGIRTTQGQYLTICTPNLYQVLLEALGLEAVLKRANSSDLLGSGKPTEYQEGQRKLRETKFFTRNPKLAAEAKRQRNYTCEVCQFNFQQYYGKIGETFAECHHKNPLSERPEEMWSQNMSTSLNDVAVVCSNCHRMLHRERPALSIEDLKAKIEATRQGAETP